MAQTTTAINACGAVIKIDNSSPTLTDISGSSNNASLSFSVETATGVTFEGDWNFRLQCKKDASLEIAVMWTTTTDEGRELLETWFAASSPGARTVEVYPNGTATGERVYSGEFLIEELSIPMAANEAGPIVATATLSPDGAVTFGTAA